ncbi:DUF790 family protein [Fluviispira multicolorata]|uniref:DUF790 family protein n=1 Tax=Fluviispira multicolorata TaxID=2654512 RepID=UPI001375F18C|nr:DUF790 family protein [Fluviispira multicolorata]
MLTKKELLLFKKNKGKIIPLFIDAKDPLLLEYAKDLIEVFLNSLGKKRRELEEEISHINSVYDYSNELQKGIVKLLFDRLEFKTSLGDEVIDFREVIFTKSCEYFNSNKNISYDSYIKSISEDINLFSEEIKLQLYSDLPEFHTATHFKSIQAKDLLNRYNLALSQGFLFHSSAIVIKIPIKENAKLEIRYLLKQIRFFQLVANIQITDDFYEIVLDGPLSLFMHTQKYGFNLASFFPSLVLLSQWEISADIQLGRTERSKGVLNLSYESPLVSHYKNFSAYSPDEFKMFAELFRKKNGEWNIELYLDEIFYDGNNYFFPDYEFTAQNKKVFLELFHPWHKTALKQRIVSIEKKKISGFIIGVSKALLKDIELQKLMEDSNYFKENGFIFREMPTVSQVSDILNRV